MRTTIQDKLKMAEAHILEGKSLSHVLLLSDLISNQ